MGQGSGIPTNAQRPGTDPPKVPREQLTYLAGAPGEDSWDGVEFPGDDRQL